MERVGSPSGNGAALKDAEVEGTGETEGEGAAEVGAGGVDTASWAKGGGEGERERKGAGGAEVAGEEGIFGGGWWTKAGAEGNVAPERFAGLLQGGGH